MTDYNGFGTATTTGQGAGAAGGLAWQNDPGAYTFGQTFTVDASGYSAKGVRWYVPDGVTDAPTSGYYIGLYEVGNTTPLATAGPFSGITIGAWNSANFATPVALSASPAQYRAAVLFPGGYYSAQTPNAVPWDPAGPINFPSSGIFNSGSSLTYPNSASGSSPSYGIDVTVTDGVGSNTADFVGSAPSATGANVFTVTSVAFAGSAQKATGANSFTTTSASFAGSAPSATGVNIFAPPISVSLDSGAPKASGTMTFRLEGEADEEPGSWYGLLSISQEYRARLAEERTAVPVACPNDGEPLRTGPRGELYCPYDGWRPRP